MVVEVCAQIACFWDAGIAGWIEWCQVRHSCHCSLGRGIQQLLAHVRRVAKDDRKPRVGGGEYGGKCRLPVQAAQIGSLHDAVADHDVGGQIGWLFAARGRQQEQGQARYVDRMGACVYAVYAAAHRLGNTPGVHVAVKAAGFFASLAPVPRNFLEYADQGPGGPRQERARPACRIQYAHAAQALLKIVKAAGALGHKPGGIARAAARRQVPDDRARADVVGHVSRRVEYALPPASRGAPAEQHLQVGHGVFKDVAQHVDADLALKVVRAEP